MPAPKGPTTASVATAYFAAVADRDLDAMAACWTPGGHEHIHGWVDTTAPDGVREFFGGLFAAIPDFSIEVLQKTVSGPRAVVRWRMTGTFTGAEFQGIEPTGAPIELTGMDELTVKNGLITENNAFSDGLTFARQIGMLPPEGSKADQRVMKAFNAKTRLARRLAGAGAEPVADGVWLVRGGFPKRLMNVYLVKDDGGVLAFDAGIKGMVKSIAAAAAPLGGLTRVVLGHGHADHRGAAPGLPAPVFCHTDDRAFAEGDGGAHTFDFAKLNPVGKRLMPVLLESWDGGPVKIEGTFSEGDDIAGFEVVHLPGHAPGLVGLWRAGDRLALTSDCFYTIDPQTSIKGPPRVPHPAFNVDSALALASIKKVAALEPAAAWPGHAEPVTGDVRGQLEAVTLP